jgi:hypothetical protein
LIRRKVTIQQVWRNVELMIAVPLSADCFAIACRTMVVTLCLRVLMTDMPFWRIKRPTRPLSWFANKPQPGSGMPDIQADLFQLLSLARPAIAAKAKTRGKRMCANVTKSDR